MWMVIYMSCSGDMVKKLTRVLIENSILFKVRTVDKPNAEEDSCCYEVLVPQAEMDEAQNLIIDEEIN